MPSICYCCVAGRLASQDAVPSDSDPFPHTKAGEGGMPAGTGVHLMVQGQIPWTVQLLIPSFPSSPVVRSFLPIPCQCCYRFRCEVHLPASTCLPTCVTLRSTLALSMIRIFSCCTRLGHLYETSDWLEKTQLAERMDASMAEIWSRNPVNTIEPSKKRVGRPLLAKSPVSVHGSLCL